MTESKTPWRPGVLVGDRGTKVVDVVRTLANVVDSIPTAVLGIVAEYVPPLRIPWRALIERNSSFIVSVPLNIRATLYVEYRMPSDEFKNGSVLMQVITTLVPSEYGRSWTIYKWIRHLMDSLKFSPMTLLRLDELVCTLKHYSTGHPLYAIPTMISKASVVFRDMRPCMQDPTSKSSLLRTLSDHGYDSIADDIKPYAPNGDGDIDHYPTPSQYGLITELSGLVDVSCRSPPKTPDEIRLELIREMHARRVAQWLNANIPHTKLVVRGTRPFEFVDDTTLLS